MVVELKNGAIMLHEVMTEVTKIVSPVYLVGGAVRDHIMGKEINDWDFTTPVVPEEIEVLVRTNNPGRTVFDAGKRWGTLGTKVLLPESGKFVKVEVTTFRTETYEPNSRKPVVEFSVHLHEDLVRRDFTMNAIAARMDGKSVRIIDPFGGREDIEKGIIRGVGNVKQNMKDDPVRMLRAARFVSTLGFEVDEETKAKITRCAPRILMPSKERWLMELDKLLLGDHVEKGLDFLAETRLLTYMIPELFIQVGYDQETPYHDFDLWTHTKKVVAATPKDITLRWAALLHDVAKPFVAVRKNESQKNYMNHETVGRDMVLRIGPFLKWKTERTKEVAQIVAEHLEEGSVLKAYDSGSQKRS